MSTTFSSNESIIGYVTNISNEHKKKKFYVKFSMQSNNDRQIDGWIFSGVTGILATPLGLALTNSLKNHTGLKIWGKIEDNNGELHSILMKVYNDFLGLTVFRTQSWANHQKFNLDFSFQVPTNNLLSIRDAINSIEPCNIQVFIIDIRPSQNFNRQDIVHTNTFILIGDETGTSYLVATDLDSNTILIDQSYNLTQVRRKMFNGVPILSTTINTNISPSMTVN
jgi:hypothetical protein